jgi:hypothetical protein
MPRKVSDKIKVKDHMSEKNKNFPFSLCAMIKPKKNHSKNTPFARSLKSLVSYPWYQTLIESMKKKSHSP